MKISYNWLKQYIHLPESPEEISDMLTGTGLEVESLEKIEPIKGGLEGLVIGQVLECIPHPNADKLKLAQVDIGDGEPKSIVCGAPNVASGQKVVVAPIGTTIYPIAAEPFTIKKAKIRGEASEGMICAEDEIGMGNDHSGIMVLDTELPIGTPAKKLFNIKPDYVIEIGLTPNRPDAASHIGVARDLRALLNREITWPAVDIFKQDEHGRAVEIEVKNYDACPRYSGVTISGITVGESPDWLKTRLLLIGLTPINNIVDITNFVLHEMGQPLHAFDADKITGNKVVVKTTSAGTPFTTLDKVDRKLQADDLMICNEQEGMCIAGIFGGVKSGITTSTTTVFLESAYFAPDYIRKTAQHHQLKTDASFRYERGTDPNITVYALKRAALMIREFAGGKISSGITDIYPKPINNLEIPVKFKNIDRLIGKKLSHETIIAILKGLEIECKNVSDESFIAIVPPYRIDVIREADVIEEVLRIYGLNNIELPEYASTSFIAKFPENDPDRQQAIISDLLVANGYYEIITNSLTKPVYAEKLENKDRVDSVEIVNKLSEDLGVMRQSLLFSGLEVVSHNINRQQRNIKLFEFGKTYSKSKKGYKEKHYLGIWLSGKEVDERWRHDIPSDFYSLSSIVSKVLGKLTMEASQQAQLATDPFEYALEIKYRNVVAGLLGKLKQSHLKLLNIKQETFYAELDWDLLLTLANDNIVVEDVPKFPEVRRDLSLVVDKKVSFENLNAIAMKSAGNLLKRMFVFDVYEGDKIDANKKAYAIGFILQDKTKTLTDKQIDKAMQTLMHKYEEEAGAFIRQ